MANTESDLQQYFEFLSTLPRIGLGSFICDTHEDTKQELVNFFRSGGRLIEISELFSNFQLVLPALEIAELNREDIFIIVKIWPQSQTPADLLNRIERFLSISHLLYIDILIAHAPIDMNHRFEQWKALETVKSKQQVRAIGVANLSLNHLMTVIKIAHILPTFFQMEVTPFIQQKDIIEYCYAGSITVINQEPIGKRVKDSNIYLREIADKLKISVEELLFRWSITKGYVTMIPSSSRVLKSIPLEQLSTPLSEDVMKILDKEVPAKTVNSGVFGSSSGASQENETPSKKQSSSRSLNNDGDKNKKKAGANNGDGRNPTDVLTTWAPIVDEDS